MDFDNKVRLLQETLQKSFQIMLEIGFIREQDGAKGFALDVGRADQLEEKGMAAAASINDELDKPVMYFNPSRNECELVWDATHEAVHLAQIAKGDLEPWVGGKSWWKGRLYDNLSTSDPLYFSPDHQPWEHEAQEVQKIIRERLGMGWLEERLKQV